MGVLHALPVTLKSAPFTLATNAGPSVFSFQPGIQNTESVGVMIDKIAFIAPLSMQFELKWRNEQLTSGLVVLGAMSWPQSNPNDNTAPAHTIKLSRPMYLAPGDYITVVASNNVRGAAPQSTAMQLVAIGRQCAAPPSERWIPYLTDYVGPIYTNNSGATISDQSTAADLGNPYDTPLVVERLIGRILTASGANYFAQEPTPLWNSFNMRVSDSRDNFWVANPTAIQVVCDAVYRSWILNHTLEPKAFLRVEFEGIANVIDGTTTSRAVVGLVGYRRIA